MALLMVVIPTIASHVQPTFTDDAESCGILTPGTVEFLVDASQLGSGIPSSGQFRVEVQLSGSLDGGSVSFMGATLPVEAAFVAGTSGGHLYDYPEPVRADDGLVAPNGQPITNVSFCYVVADAGASPTDGTAGGTGGQGRTAPPTDTVAPAGSPPHRPNDMIVIGLLLIGAGVWLGARTSRRRVR